MKISIIVFSMLLAMQTAFSQTPYFSAGAGISSLPDAKITSKADGTKDVTKLEYNSTHSFNAAFGVDYENGYKVELHLSVQKNEGNQKDDKTNKLRQKSETLGVNVIREFSSGRWVPFVSAGAGFVFTDLVSIDEDPAESDKFKDTSVSFNVGGGISYNISDTYSLYGQYKYYIISDFEDSFTEDLGGQILTVDLEMESAMHQFDVGITRSF